MQRAGWNRFRVCQVVLLALRIGTGFVFIWSGLPKIRLPYDFLSDVYGYQLVGGTLGVWVAAIVPWLELVLGLCLLGGLWVAGALVVGGALSAVFVFAQASALFRGLSISCGCFSSQIEGMVSHATLIRAVMLLIAATLAFWLVVVSPRLVEDR